ncbi:hypothetical protein D3C71_1076060 [compost metagenome]
MSFPDLYIEENEILNGMLIAAKLIGWDVDITNASFYHYYEFSRNDKKFGIFIRTWCDNVQYISFETNLGEREEVTENYVELLNRVIQCL